MAKCCIFSPGNGDPFAGCHGNFPPVIPLDAGKMYEIAAVAAKKIVWKLLFQPFQLTVEIKVLFTGVYQYLYNYITNRSFRDIMISVKLDLSLLINGL